MAKGSKYDEVFWARVKRLAEQGKSPSEVALHLRISENKFFGALRSSGNREWFNKYLRPRCYIEIEGVVDTIKGHCERYKLNYPTLMYKRKRGDSLEKLFGRPVREVESSELEAEKAA